MAYEMKELSGSLFKNKKREKDSHPNVKGSCLIEGKEYWISAWTKTDKNGDPWQSLSFTPKEKFKKSQNQSKPQKTNFDDLPDVPF